MTAGAKAAFARCIAPVPDGDGGLRPCAAEIPADGWCSVDDPRGDLGPGACGRSTPCPVHGPPVHCASHGHRVPHPDKCRHEKLHAGRFDANHTVCLQCGAMVRVAREHYANGEPTWQQTLTAWARCDTDRPQNRQVRPHPFVSSGRFATHEPLCETCGQGRSNRYLHPGEGS